MSIGALAAALFGCLVSLTWHFLSRKQAKEIPLKSALKRKKNLPDDLKVLVDSLAHIRAMRLLHRLDTTPGQALALNFNALVRKFCHEVSLLLGRLILGRFRDVASRMPFEAATGTAEVPDDEGALHFSGSSHIA